MSEILIGKGEKDVFLLPKYANRHGMVAGATGTGKSVSLMLLAEGFSKLGVPVFLADVKGDLAGLAGRATASEMLKRAETRHRRGQRTESRRSSGTCSASRATRCAPPSREMGPLLLARILDLNDTQSGVLESSFKIADDRRPAAARPQGPARAAELVARERQGALHQLRQRRRRLDRRHPARAAACWSSRAAQCSSASRRWSSPT
jgi:DNA helicase HerA-like ATPase